MVVYQFLFSDCLTVFLILSDRVPIYLEASHVVFINRNDKPNT